MDAIQFRFRESEVGVLRNMLGDCGILERPGQPSDLLLRLQAAGMVEEDRTLEPLVSYFLTPEAKQSIRKALG